MRALRLDTLSGGRVFSYGLDASPTFRRFLVSGTPGLGLWSFFLSRQALAPYANVIDRIELAEGKDLTAFVPRAPELAAEDYDPARIGGDPGPPAQRGGDARRQPRPARPIPTWD